VSGAGCFVVTGASDGIGETVARRLIARGENVLAVARRKDRLEALCGTAENARFAAVDLEGADAVEAVARAVKDTFGAVRGFVHCAGFNQLAPLSLVDSVVAQRLYAVHALFPMRFMGWLGKAPNHVVGAACVLISSLACHEGAAGNAAYAAAKGAVEGILKPAAAELAPKGIRLNEVILGVVETEMAHTWMGKLTPEQFKSITDGYPMGLGKPAEVAKIIAFLLGDDSTWITGQALICDGGHTVM